MPLFYFIYTWSAIVQYIFIIFAPDKNNIMKKYKCRSCGYIYDPVEGDPDSGIAPGTAFEDIPDSWSCPICGVKKEDFEPVD